MAEVLLLLTLADPTVHLIGLRFDPSKSLSSTSLLAGSSSRTRQAHLIAICILSANSSLEMSSNAGQSTAASKAVNTSNTSGAPATFHSTAPSDNSFPRRAGGSGSLGTGISSRNLGAARNNQARKSQHKSQRKPRLLDDDEYSESVGSLRVLFEPERVPIDTSSND